MNEKRRHPRVVINASATYELPDGTSAIGNVTDLSMGGLFIETSSPPPFGSKVTIALDLDPTGGRLRVDGIVRWGKPGGFGVQFGLMGARETHALANFIKRHQQQD